MTAALSLTCTDLAKALSNVTYPKVRTKWVIDEDTGARVGSMRFHDNRIDWRTMHDEGWADSEADAMAKIERAILARRAEEAFEAAYRAEVDALPEPIRTLTIVRDRAAIRVERERHRTILREDGLKAAEDALTDAEMALAAAERARAEAA